MTVHGKFDHKWVGFQPCECGDPGPADVFAFLQSPKGREWSATPPPWEEPQPHEAHLDESDEAAS